jgi:energy-coupling factor transporter ATP-binding protein EcfA2
MRVFDRLNRAGRTVALITHESEVAQHAKRVIHLSDGVIVSDERQADLHDPPPQLQPARAQPGMALEVALR